MTISNIMFKLSLFKQRVIAFFQMHRLLKIHMKQLKWHLTRYIYGKDNNGMLRIKSTKVIQHFKRNNK